MAKDIKAGKSAKEAKVKSSDEAPRATRGGARAGAGRKSGSGAFGEGTVPMRIPASMAGAVDKALEEFKRRVAQAKLSGASVAPLDMASLGSNALSMASVSPGSPGGKPVDLAKALAKRPESCFAWTAPAAQADIGIQQGDVLVVDRAAKASAGSVVAHWGESGLELSAFKKGDKGAQHWGVAVALVRKLAD